MSFQPRIDGQHRSEGLIYSVSIRLPIRSRERSRSLRNRRAYAGPFSIPRMHLLGVPAGLAGRYLQGDSIFARFDAFVGCFTSYFNIFNPVSPPYGIDMCTTYVSKYSAIDQTSMRLDYFHVRELFLTADIRMSFPFPSAFFETRERYDLVRGSACLSLAKRCESMRSQNANVFIISSSWQT